MPVVLDRRALLMAGAVLPLAGRAAAARAALGAQTFRINAPFAMPDIVVPDFAAAPRFAITRFGASQGSQARTTAAIARAIAAASKAGGGVVVVPPGTWPTGGIRLRSNVNLHLQAGATLAFSPDPADYLPPVPTSWEGLECMNYAPLIYAHECQNVAITGRGKVLARMDVWEQWAARPKPHMDALVALYQLARAGVLTAQRDMTSPAISNGQAHLRPHFVQFNRCQHVLVQDITIENSPFWTVHLYLCQHVVVSRATIRARGHNNDGVDPEMSQNVLIEDCVFDQGDDAVSVKSGREYDGWALATPSRNIVVRGCTVYNGHQLMAVGSELAGGIENVWVDSCRVVPHEARETNSPLNNLLFVKTNERRGGFVRNIHLTNIVATKLAGGVLAVDTDALFQWRTILPTYERRLTPIEGLHVANIRVEQAAYRVNLRGEHELPPRDITLRNVAVGKVAAWGTLANVASFSDT
jgi:polygalacturonase